MKIPKFSKLQSSQIQNENVTFQEFFPLKIKFSKKSHEKS